MIVWLASYPKSGNTWLRIFLANYCSELDEPVNINEVYDYGLGFQDTDLRAWKVGDYLPPKNLQPMLRRQALETLCTFWPRDHIFVKTHYIRAEWAGYPVIPVNLTYGAVYVVRHPDAVAESCSRFFGFSPAKTAYRMNRSDLCLDHNGVDQWLGTWSEHVNSWKGAYVIRYEDMRDDPHETFGEMLEVMELPTDRLDKAIEFSQLGGLKAQEAEGGYVEDLGGKGFFGQTTRRLNKTQKARIRRDHGEMMERHEYL